MQALYQWQMSGNTPSQIIAEFEASGSLKKADRDFFHELLRGAVLAPGQEPVAPIPQFGSAALVKKDAEEEAEPVEPASPTNDKGFAASESTAIKPCAVDALFAGFLDRGTHELDKVELSILRAGSYELKNRIDVPFRVVIDEYVELTKLFGAEDAHKYINGVLDKVAGQTREVEVQARRAAPAKTSSDSAVDNSSDGPSDNTPDRKADLDTDEVQESEHE